MVRGFCITSLWFLGPIFLTISTKYQILDSKYPTPHTMATHLGALTEMLLSNEAYSLEPRVSCHKMSTFI